MRWQMSSQSWTCCPGRIPRTLRWDWQYQELHLCILASCVFFAYIVFVFKHLLYHLLISDLGNSLHAVVMAVHDLPYTFWPVSSGWPSGVRRQQGHSAHHGPHTSHCKGKLEDIIFILFHITQICMSRSLWLGYVRESKLAKSLI